MVMPEPRLQALMLEDEITIRSAAAVILDRLGFEVATVQTAGEAIIAAKRMQPHTVLVDAALTGARGLHLLTDLLTVAPHAAIVLLSPFEGLREPALRLGARGMVGLTDLRPLERCVEQLRAPAHVRCDCCPAVADGAGTSIANDPGSSRAGGEVRSSGPWIRYQGPTRDASSTASTAGSDRRKPPPS